MSLTTSLRATTNRHPMRLTPAQIEVQNLPLTRTLAAQPGLSFAVLVGSRATGNAHLDSDWDVAVQWARYLAGTEKLQATEQLRQALKNTLGVPEAQIDLIDLADARLAMRVLVAEEGITLNMNDDLAWVRYLQNTWAELEDNQWRQQHAA